MAFVPQTVRRGYCTLQSSVLVNRGYFNKPLVTEHGSL